MNALGEDFASAVATSESGIALIYKALDSLVEQFELDDAAVVIEEASLGQQVFCAGRRPLGIDDEELLVSAARPLHASRARRPQRSTAR